MEKETEKILFVFRFCCMNFQFFRSKTTLWLTMYRKAYILFKLICVCVNVSVCRCKCKTKITVNVYMGI